jgi:hypothetical protein
MLKYYRAILLFLFFVTTSALALPFTIVPAPGTSLPTTVTFGGTAVAYYEITNNAIEALNNNFMKYLPPNVTQVTSDATVPALCGGRFSLTPNGTPGASCTLELAVTGGVDANDPNPRHHLFACLFGGVLCAGTNYPLNVTASTAPPTVVSVTVTPASQSVLFGQTLLYTATANFSDGTSQIMTATWISSNTAVATINSSSGLAATVSAGTTTITATVASGATGTTTLTVANLSVVGGDYLSTTNTLFPVVVQSQDNGASWAYSQTSLTTSAYPTTGFSTGAGNGFHVVSTSCGGLHCVNVGYYLTSGSTDAIYGNQTTNGGTSWAFFLSQTGPLLPTGYVSGQMSAVNCLEAMCIASGGYSDVTSTHPFVAQTLNSGTTWTTAVDSTTPITAGYTAANLLSATCVSAICVAGGTYTDIGGKVSPLLVQSANGGASWTAGIDDTTPITGGSAGFDDTINGTGCNATFCIAAGNYIPGIIEDMPLIFESTNAGGTWTNVVSGSTIVPPTILNGKLTNASCGDTTCVAAGVYALNDSSEQPLIYQRSAGSGGTYSITLDAVTGPPMPSDYNGIDMTEVSSSCSGALCVVSGSYQVSSNIFEPLVAVSHDGGTSWTFAVTSTTPAQPSDFDGISMGGTNCKGTYCVISGSYDNSGAQSQPFVLVSNNSGVSWTFVVSSASPAPPSDSSQIFLFGSGVASQSLRDRLQEKTKKTFDSRKNIKSLLYTPS